MSQFLAMKRLLGGSAIYGLGGMAGRLVTLLLLPVFTAYLTPGEYGVVSMLTVGGGFVAPVFTLGLGSSIGIAYFNTREPAERQDIIWSASAVLLASALVLTLLGWALRQSLSHVFLADEGYGAHTAVAMATIALGILAMPWQLKLQFEERATAFVLVSFLGLVATVGASLWLVVGREEGAMGVLVGSLVGQTTGTLLLFATAAGKPSVKHILRWARELLRHGLPFIPSFFFLFLLQNWVRWPLEWHHGLDAVGIYSVGSGLGSALGILTAAFISAWTPFALSHADRQAEAVEVLGRVTFYYVAGFGFLTCLFFLYATPIVQIFAQTAFHSASEVVGLSAVGQFLSSLFLMLLPPLYFAKRVGNVVATQAVATAIVFFLGEILVPSFGIRGAAATVVLGFSVLVVVQWIALQRMPVLRIRYDYQRAGLLFVVFGVVAALSFRISFADMGLGFTLAGGTTLVTAAIVFLRICRLQEALRAWRGTK
jgi:O-antigen/teichoic acid export membrane protein